MDETEKQAAITGDLLAIEHLKRSVEGGDNWFTSLMESIRLWKSQEEIYNGERYLYLIDGQAFDWLRLAERLCEEISGRIPEKELEALLFYDRPPEEVLHERFKDLLGPSKYQAYLNYLYGVLAEEALIQANIFEVRKRSLVPLRGDREIDMAYLQIYGATQQQLLEAFRKEKEYMQSESIELTEMKEFLYWLFKYRVKVSEKTRIASDTKKALTLMYRKMSARRT